MVVQRTNNSKRGTLPHKCQPMTNLVGGVHIRVLDVAKVLSNTARSAILGGVNTAFESIGKEMTIRKYSGLVM